MRLVASAALLVGIIAVFQIAYQLKFYSAEALTFRALGWFAWRELGPIAVALLVVTRSASRIAGELAAMAVNSEIDALRVMGLDPVKYLVAPKLGALVVALPALTIIADGLIALGGWIAGTFFLRYHTLFYLQQLQSAFAMRDVGVGIVKALVFSFVIAVVAADEGLNVGRATGDIGAAATRAVVFCLLGVLAADSIVNAVFYFIPGLAL
jgi:phospholipid/cholesterol/gamma-HCH transport system permease protein